jgi:prepilin-type processing-associated H-X9-DG protein
VIKGQQKTQRHLWNAKEERMSMRPICLSLCLGFTLVGWYGLAAREEAPAALKISVPDKTQLYVSIKVGKLWNGDLGKQIRAAMGKELEKMILDPVQRELRLDLDQLDRYTGISTDLEAMPSSSAFILTSKKALNGDELLQRLLPTATVERIHGHKVYVTEQMAAFVSPDDKTLGFGARPLLEKMLAPKAAKPTGWLASVIEKGASHDAVAYVVPTGFASLTKEIPAVLAVVKPLLATQEGAAWGTIDYESKANMSMRFADEKSAERGRKAVNALRTLAGLTLSGTADTFAAKSKPLADLMHRAEKALDDATLEQKGTEVHASVNLKLDKAEITSLIKDAMIPLREAAQRSRSTNHLRQIGLAMHNFHDTVGAFPAAASYDKDGKPLLSWRVHILPYLEQDALYREFKLDEPWDSEHNKKLIAKMPAIYAVPDSKPSLAGGTFYQGFVGKGAAFEGKRGIGLLNFTDGTSNTILVVEAAKDVPWTKPEDLPFDADAKMLPKLGGHFEGGFNALYADGSVRFLKDTIKSEILKAFITRNGGEVIPAMD